MLSPMKTRSTSLVAREMKLQLRDIVLYLTDWQRSKSLIPCCVGKGVGNKSSFTCKWKGKLVQPPPRAIWQYLSKLKIYIPFNPAIPFLGIHHTNILACVQINVWPWIFIAALLIITIDWKEPNFPPGGD